ncbi:pupal cuticle protein 27-like [Vanessa cardui]|uniref:pupal cuticle protein 27-like n=1 Tax=Vanessa cardui TaxID=171605 RepID=UPI001F12D218|nr:pupal cuticle protein 27-like [Vanessa cardui]
MKFLMFQIIFFTILAWASAAQLPSASYLPQSPGAPGSSQFGPSGQGSGNNRPQQAEEKNSAILKLDQEVGENGFRYSYETSNGIQAEESGDTVQTRGAFAYKGDDGKVYSVTFTAGEDGYRPQGDHLPVPPPTPEEILLALKQNEQDEAAGIFDDGDYNLYSKATLGKYRPDNDGQGNGGGRPGQGSAGQGNYNPNSGYTY